MRDNKGWDFLTVFEDIDEKYIYQAAKPWKENKIVRVKRYIRVAAACIILVAAIGGGLTHQNEVKAAWYKMTSLIGRIMGVSNYIDAGVKLAEEYDFPKELTDIIRQHSMRHEKPKSLEAAIVLFTDCIVSTNDYLEKSGQKEGVSTQKLVEGIFQNRLSKGTLSESGLSQQQIDKLRHFYIKQYFNG